MNPSLPLKMFFKLLTALRLPKLRWSLMQQFPRLFFLPHMEPGEFALFKKYCRQPQVFLEYGSGGSTIWLLKKGKKVYSVDSNKDFYKYMHDIDLVREASGKNLYYQLIDLGPTDKWGKPLNEVYNSGWEAYYKNIWQSINPATEKLDVVFIDGRFRINCCYYSLIKLLEYGWNDTLIVMHDFWRRKKYHVVLQFLDEVESSSNLAVFRMKKDISIDAVREALEENALVMT